MTLRKCYGTNPRTGRRVGERHCWFDREHGGARGADTLAGEWGKRKGLPVLRVDANWDYYDKAAGPIRNQWMIDFAFPTYAVGFPGHTGTSDMAERCVEAGLPLWRPVP